MTTTNGLVVLFEFSIVLYGADPMKRSTAIAILTGLLLSPGVGFSQEVYTIKLKESAAGESLFIKRSNTMTSKVSVTNAGQVLLDKTASTGEVLEYKEHFIEAGADKKPIKIERAYSKAMTTKDDDKIDPLLAGKTVVIVKKGEDYEFTFKDGTKLEGEAAAALDKDFNKKKKNSNAAMEKAVMPKGPVKVGESWKVDMPKFIAAFADSDDMALDVGTAKGQGTLVKAYKKDGRQFGEMKFKMELPIVSAGKGQFKFSPGAKMVFDLYFDVCIDGTSEAGTMKGNMVINGTAVGPNGIMMSISGGGDSGETRTDAK
jgi:hypothetical protein